MWGTRPMNGTHKSTRELITLPTLDLGEPKGPHVLQRKRYDFSILDVHRRVRCEIEFVPSTERLGTERERHLEVVATGLRDVVGEVSGWSVCSVWVSLDEVGD